MAVTKKGKGNVSNSYEVEVDAMKPVSQEGEEIKQEDVSERKVKVKGLQELELSDGDIKKLLAQVNAEYKFATNGLKDWQDKNLRRLKLYNNQMRGEQYVGEPLIYTHINTWLASLYDDVLERRWIPREDGDIKTAENLSILSEYDYEVMDKAELDYVVKWDSLFYSYGLVDMIEFDLDNKCVAPNIIDPNTFYYDTLGSSIDGNNKGAGSMRFLGWELFISKKDIESNPMFYPEAINKLGNAEKDHYNSSVEKARKERIEALGGNYATLSSEALNDNTIYTVIQHRTYWEGKKVVLFLDQKREQLLGGMILPVDEDDVSLSWWVVAYVFSPQAHQFKGVSIPDLIEDKQRRKSVLINDALNITRDTTYGSYFYDENKIKNKGDLKWGYDKFVPTDGNPNDVVVPMRKDSPNLPLLNNMLNYLDISAQTATATPSLQQGVLSEEQRTLGELNLVAQSTKTRYSLALKSMASADRDFWRLWYLALKVYWRDGIGEKVVRIAGSTAEFRPLSTGDVLCKVDPDIRIESKTLSEMNRLKKFQQYAQVLELILQDPDADKRAGIKHAMHLAGLDSEEIDAVLPPTSDEMIAKQQNETLNAGKLPPILPNDNHLVHLRVHKEAIENKQKRIHMMAHLDALRILQQNPDLIPQGQPLGMQQGEAPVQGTPQMQGQGEVPVTQRPPSAQANMNNNAI